ncbi:glycosyl transferase [Fennellomyces sp. T-0311]|nr:glycosyl transferase [Fennellomyces sp. T-0311]
MQEIAAEENDQTPPYLLPQTVADQAIPFETWENLPVKGAFYMLVRNENIQEARSAMRSVEDRFNHQYKYPWVLLNNQDFSPSFRKYITMLTDAPIYFGKIDLNAWNYPSWIDVASAEQKMEIMHAMQVYKGASLSFRQMLRYQSGLFVHHPLLRDVDYIWRVEPESDYPCDMEDFDPFVYMQRNNKTLGYTLTMREAPEVVSNLWSDTRRFMDERSELILPFNETIMPWITDETKEEYNMCHMWSNFEIVEAAFLRSKAYQDYFEFLDHRGGFFYERWGDAPIRTMAAAMFLPRDRIHFFNRIGYSHSVASHCPINREDNLRCSCDMHESYGKQLHEGAKPYI